MNHLSGELLKSQTGITDLPHVPYRGAGPAHGRRDRRTDSDHRPGDDQPGARIPSHRQIAPARDHQSDADLPIAPEIPTAIEAGVPAPCYAAGDRIVHSGRNAEGVAAQIAAANRTAMADKAYTQSLVDAAVIPVPGLDGGEIQPVHEGRRRALDAAGEGDRHQARLNACCDESFAPPISASGCGCGRAAGRRAHRARRSLSDAAGAAGHRLQRRRRARRGGAAVVPMAVGAGRAEFSGREPARRRRQYRRARRSCGRRPTAIRCCRSVRRISSTPRSTRILKFNFLRDIAPVASIGRNPFVMVVNPSFPAKTVAEFIAYAKANPGQINMTSTGTGNLTHVVGELFKMMAGVDMLHVPGRGEMQAQSDLFGRPGAGHVRSDRLLPRLYQGRPVARARRHRRDAAVRRCPTCRPSAKPCRVST